jgi:TonB-linked SusC/RagA family outer membrane protein
MHFSASCLLRITHTQLKKLLLVMKLTTLLILIGFLQVNAAVYGQRINLNANNISMETLFKQLEKQSGYSFFYKASTLKNLPKIDVEINDASIDEVLQKCFKNKPLDYLVVDKSVVIRRKDLPQIAITVSQNRLISGKVFDEKGNPLPGANLKLKNAQNVWITNANGEFIALLIDPKDDAVLQVSYVGYTTQEFIIKDIKSPLIITLKPDIGKLDEIQVIAYGQTTKRFNVGDQTTITAKDIAKYPVTNVLEALQASVPGMNIIKTTGMPGGVYSVKIRGQNGINNGTGTDPLYVVDGVPYQGGYYDMQNSTLGGLPGKSGIGGDALSFINPQDIESINVLKDATATSIYGSRAANGVILITTKRGKAGNVKIDLNVYQGTSKVTRLPNFLNTRQYLEMRHEAYKNDGPSFAAAYDINGTWDTTRYTNWAKELIGGASHTTNAQATISGGNANTQFLISGNYNTQSNLMKLGGSYQNASAHFSINSATSDNKFSVSFTGGYLYNNNTIKNVDFTSSVSLSPDAPPIYNPDGTLNFQNGTFYNPYTATQLINSTPASNLTSSAILSYRPIKGLEIKLTSGYNRQEINEFLGSPTTSYAPFLNVTTGSSRFTTDVNSTWSVEPQINYNRKISKGDFTATVGASLQEQTSASTQLTVTGYTSDALLKSISAGTKITNTIPYGYDKSRFAALFGRLGYIWDGKYIIDVSGRYDGSSKFGPNRQYHLFGAVGGGWIFTKEKFFKNALSFIDLGKLTASYGITGNDQIGSYRFLQSYYAVTADIPYQGVPGLSAGSPANPNLSWETTKKAKLGIDLHFLNERIELEADYYRNRTSGVLYGYPLSIITGSTSIVSNLPALVQNKGWELTLNTVNIRSNNFSWSSTGLLTIPRTALIKYPSLNTTSFANAYVLGMPTTIQKVYRFAGVNTQTGVYQFYNKDGNIKANPVAGIDNTAIINTEPKFYGSLQNSFAYNGFTLDFTFRFINQVGKNAFGQNGLLPPGLGAENVTTDMLARWQKPGDVTNIQRFGTSFALLTPLSNAKNSTAAFGDASYIRFQNLSLGYSFKQPVLTRLHLQNLRVYIQGDNLFTISKYGNLDPENQSAYRLPPLRTITAGLQVTL